MPKTSSPKPIAELNYEKAFAELESIVTALETGQHSLDESMSLYERGQALVKHCVELLDKAELKVKQMSGNETTDFAEE